MIPELNETWQITDSSKLNEFITCPRAYFYQYLLGWRLNQPNIHLVFGTAWHEAMEHLLLYGYGNKSILDAYDKFIASFRSEFIDPQQDEMFHPKTPSNAFVVLAKYADKYQREAEYEKTLFTEIGGSVVISEKHKLFFRMDSIIENLKNNTIFSREHKTGSRVWEWANQWLIAIQVGTYSHVLFCNYPEELVGGIEMNASFFIKRKKDPYDFLRVLVSRTRDQMQVWLDTVEYYMTELDKEMEVLDSTTESDSVLNAFPIRPTSCFRYGRMCEYHDYCLAWANPVRNCYEPPIGFKIEFWNPMAHEIKHEIHTEI